MKKTLFLSAILGAALCSSAFGAENNFLDAAAGTTVQVDVTSGHLKGENNGSTYTTVANLNITNLIITNGFSRPSGITQKFTGTITGSGPITRTDGQTKQYWVFTGDMSEYTGAMTMNGSTNTLTFGEAGGTMSVGASSISLLNSATLKTAGNVTFTRANIEGANMSVLSGTTTLGENAQFSVSQAVTLANGTTLALSNGTTLNLSAMAHTDTYDGSAGSGISSWTGTYTLATGNGTVTRTGSQHAMLAGTDMYSSLTWAEDNKTFTVTDTLYHVREGAENSVSMSDVTTALSGSGASRIVVDGTLTGLNDTTCPSINIVGSGIVQVNGELQYYDKNFLEHFTGTVEITSGDTHIGDKGDKFANVSNIKVSGGALKGWGTTFGRNITLAGGTLSDSGREVTYSGDIVIESASTIQNTSGNTTTLQGYVNAIAGDVTILGSVKSTDGGFDMSGSGNDNTSKLVIETGATFTSEGALWVTSKEGNHTTIELKEGGKFVKGNYTITGLEGGGSFVAGGTGQLGMNGNHTYTDVDMLYTGGNQTTQAILAGATTLKKTGSGVLTFQGSLGADATLEGVLTGTTSTVKHNVAYGENQGTLKNVQLVAFKAASTTSSITLDGACGHILNNATQGHVTLIGNGLTLNEGYTNGKYTFTAIDGSGKLQKGYAVHETFTFNDATGWTGSFINTGGLADVTFEGNSNAQVVSQAATNLTLKGTDYSLMEISAKNGSTTKVELNANSGDVTIGQLTQTPEGSTAGHINVNLSNGHQTNITNNATVDSVTLANNSSVMFNSLNVGTLTVESGSSNVFCKTVNQATGVGIGADTNHTLNSVVVNSNASLTFGSAHTTVGAITLGTDSAITVGDQGNHNYSLTTTDLTVNGNSAINANLVIAGNGTMDFTAGHVLTMGCSVTIGEGVKVYITGSADDIRYGQEVTIMNDVEEAITLGNALIFVNGVQQNDFYLKLTDDHRIVVAPEPATATLSLLALAALCARRKRH